MFLEVQPNNKNIHIHDKNFILLEPFLIRLAIFALVI